MGEREEQVNTDTVAINVEALERSMKESLLSFGREPIKIEPCTIHRVFHSVRRDNEYAYDPQLIAIGPFHRNNPALKPMEQLKWRYLRHLCERSPRRNTLQNYIELVSEFNKEARSYYSERVEPDDNVFVETMVLDGCFLIEFLVKAYLGENLGQLNEVNWNLPLLRNDLLLLENQLPFPILELLFDLSDIPDLNNLKDDGTRVTLMDLAVCFVTKNEHETLPEATNPDTVHHLLHVYHASIFPVPNSHQDQQASCFGITTTVKTITRIKTLASIPFLWLLSSFFYCKIPLKCWGSRKSHDKQKKAKAPRGIPTATQLQDSGVQFEKKLASSSFLDATFCKEAGVMKIAELSIQEATISQFLNLIAFEQCYPKSGTHFTSHAVLMNNLIDTPEDVAILKSSHIIESKLGHDEEVAKFFNRLCKGAYLDFENHHYNQLFRNVIEYCNVDRHKWRAGLMHDYFGSPWSIASLVAAIFLLILTVVQTFYSLYAYYNPRS